VKNSKVGENGRKNSAFKVLQVRTYYGKERLNISFDFKVCASQEQFDNAFYAT